MAVPSSGGFSKRVAGILATAVPGRGGYQGAWQESLQHPRKEGVRKMPVAEGRREVRRPHKIMSRRTYRPLGGVAPPRLSWHGFLGSCVNMCVLP